MRNRPIMKPIMSDIMENVGSTPITGLDWSALTSGVTDNLRSLWYHGGRWVVCGDNGRIITSDDDGETWTSRTSGTTLSLRTVKWWKGNWWIVGVGDVGVHTILKSSDGTSWSSVTVPGKGAASLVTIGISQGRMLFGGWEWNFADEKGLIVSTENGSDFTWTVFTDVFGVYGIEHAQGEFTICGSDAVDDSVGFVATTRDGVTKSNITTHGFGYSVWNVQHNGFQYVLGTGDGEARYTMDRSHFFDASPAELAGEWIWRITRDPFGTFLMCGGFSLSAQIHRSVDNGVSWEQVYLNTSEHVMSKAIYGPGYWLAVGWGGLIVKSTDQ